MTEPTEYCEDVVQREVDAEITLINEFLVDIDHRKHHMSHFVSGLQVAVRSILSAVDTIKRKHQEDKQTSLEEETRIEKGTNTNLCLKGKEETSGAEEELMLNTLRENEGPEDSNPSSKLMKSLNTTLGDLERAEEKLIEMDCRDHMAMAASQHLENYSCYMDFMYEFLADFRQKLQQSCEEFMSMESQVLALLKEKKALQDLSFQLTNSPKKEVKPKNYSLASTVSKATAQNISSNDSASPDTEITKKKILENDIPLDEAAAQDVDSKDSIPSETRPAALQTDVAESTAHTDTSSISQTEYIEDNTFDTKEAIKQLDSKSTTTNVTPSLKSASTTSTADGNTEDKKLSMDQTVVDEEYDFESHNIKEATLLDTKETTRQIDVKNSLSNATSPPKDTSTTSTTDITPENKKLPIDQIVVDEEYDYVSPVGMKRMFGTLSQESKIQFPPASPNRIVNNSPIILKLDLEVSPASVESES